VDIIEIIFYIAFIILLPLAIEERHKKKVAKTRAELEK
jgi:hypothetical protein